METRSAQIRSLGAAYFDQIVADREDETLHLEFKTLSHDGGQLKRDDRKMIAEAVTGLANAEGGLLIIGIETQRSDGVDVAVAKRPIKSLKRTANIVRSSIPEMLSPQHTGIDVFSVEDHGGQDEGFIVVDVPQSPDRPHYSNVHHQYFRRGSNGTRVLEHGEIRDLMFTVRQGELDVLISFQTTMSMVDGLGGNVLLSVKNVGRVPLRAPYLKVTPAGWTMAADGLEARRITSNTIGFYAGGDEIVHIDDEFHLGARRSSLFFCQGGTRNHRSLVSEIRESQDLSAFYINRVAKRRVPTDKLFGSFQVSFGAENVPPKTAKFDLSKWDMFELIAKAVLDGP